MRLISVDYSTSIEREKRLCDLLDGTVHEMSVSQLLLYSEKDLSRVILSASRGQDTR